MVDEIFPIDELPAAKRRKRWAEAHAQMELPMPSPFAVMGALICQIAQTKLEEGKIKVTKTSLDNARLLREDHERESKFLHIRRFHRSAQQKTLANRKIDKI